MTSDLVVAGLLQGLVLALVAYAVMIPFRILNFPDLTAEGAYPFGGAVCTSLLLADMPCSWVMVCTALCSGLLGIASGLIHIRLRVHSLLAGILVSTMAYSVDLRLLGKPSVSLFDRSMLFAPHHTIENIFLLLVIGLVVWGPFALFLRTEYGLRLRAVGLNPLFARKQGISVTQYTLLGLFLASALSGTAGGLMVQLQQYMDIGMGVGMVIHALAALMIGEAVIGHTTLTKQLIAPFVGAMIYQQLQGVALVVGLAPSDLKFFTGALVIGVIALRGRQGLVKLG